ncbi:MAG: DUF58 domain-containing protein [Candidatus Nanopelagicales bacterium]
MLVTGRLVLAFAVAAIVVAVAAPSVTGMVVVNSILLAVAAVDAALAGSPRRLSLRRSGDTTVRLGEAARVTLTATNDCRRRVRGVLRDAWVPSAGAAVTRHRLDLAPGATARITTELVPTRRGDRPADRVTVRCLGPLGLAGRQASYAVPWSVRTLPPFTSRKHLPSRLARLRELDGRTAVMVRGQGTEFDSLREYVVGDDVRSIDWRATARAADVMVRTWRPERDRRILVVLDTGRTSAARLGSGAGSQTRLDAEMDAALLLAALASRAGDRVDLLAYDRQVRADVRGVPATELLPALVQAMTPLEPELLETDARGLVAAVTGRVRQRALVVLLTALEPSALEEGLLPVLPALTARHQVVLAAVRDPRLDEMAAQRGDLEAVYEASAAATALTARDRAEQLLRRLGVEVVDAGPDELAPRLADAYLALKAAGRL